MEEPMKHTFTLHSKGLSASIDEQKTLVDKILGRGRPGPENEYQIGGFDVLQNARKRLDTQLVPEDYLKICTFLQEVDLSLSEGFCHLATTLLNGSLTTLGKVETVKIDTGTESTGVIDVACDVPSLYKIIVTLIVSMRNFCHDRLWSGIPKEIASVPSDTAYQMCEKLGKDAELKGESETKTSDERSKAAPKGKYHRKKKDTNKETKKKATKKEPKNKELASSGVKTAITNGGKKTK